MIFLYESMDKNDEYLLNNEIIFLIIYQKKESTVLIINKAPMKDLFFIGALLFVVLLSLFNCID